MRLAEWIARNLLAQVLGLVVLLVWFNGIFALFEGGETLLEHIGIWFLLSLGFVPAGYVFGNMQAIGVLHFLPRIDPRRWIKATITAGFAIWILMTVFLVGFESGRGLLEVPGAAGSALGFVTMAVFGALAGGILGYMQARAIPFRLAIRFWWVVANALGWGTALPIFYLGVHLAGVQGDIVMRVGYWLTASSMGGIVIGAITGVALVLMQVDRDLDAEEKRISGL